MTRRFLLCMRKYLLLGLIVLIASGAISSINSFKAMKVTAYIKASLPARIPGSDTSFVTRTGTSILLNGQPFRFSGANIYWLGLEEVNTGNGIAYPSHFQVDDALATAQAMGATVVRSHTLGISVGCSICVEPALGTFNQGALQYIDYAIQAAHNHGIRLIIPLVDNWHYYHGGKHTFTDWRGISDENQFYSNPLVIGDFEQYVSVILNHVNTYTGIAYKNDPTIMTWELGNELSAPANWVSLMAKYVKSIDSHHLVMDGNYEQADETANFLPDLSIAAIDMYTGHYYPPNTANFLKEANQAYTANKVFVAGEYDWNTFTPADIKGFLLTIQNSTAAGDLYWSLFPHADQYGFVYRKEHYTLHYPGDTLDMRTRVNLLRQHAFAMQDMSAPGVTIAGPPVISFINSNGIAWRGTAGAYMYSIERSTAGVNGPWTVICNRCATDNDSPWIDTSRPWGNVWYRVIAFSISGDSSGYSNVYHPAPVRMARRPLEMFTCKK
jgi:mannan endo-1,4-beta-mannosidase